MTPDQLVATADQLRRLLAAIDAEEMTASATTRARIEGAVVALDVVTGAAPADIVAHLTDPD